MRASTLVFLHVLVAAATIGGLLATATLAASTMRRLAGRIAVLTAVAAFATTVLGEVTKARENVGAHWLTVASAIAYAAVLLPAIAVAFLASIAHDRPALARWTAVLAVATAAVALSVAFLMAAKPV